MKLDIAQDASTTGKSKKVENFKDDYVAASMGDFGFWQLIYVSIVASARLIANWNTMSVVFLAPETKFVCKELSDNTTEEIINNTCYKNCIKYEYERDIFEETLVTEFGLICENTWLVSFTQMMMMFGLLCGVSLFGWISDRFGRSKAMILSGIICVIFMFAAPFSPSYWTVTAARFFIGLGTGGYLALTAVYNSEIVGKKLIEIVICASLIPCDGLSLPILSAFAYFSSTWRQFLIVSSSVSVFLVMLSFFLPETPRWLIAKGKVAEAVELMQKAAKFNNRDPSIVKDNVIRSIEELQINKKDAKDLNLTYLDLFRTKKLAMTTVALVMIWFVTGFSYFGLLQYISMFGSNLYIVVAVLGFAQLPASPIAIGIMKFCGRRPSCIISFVSIGVLSVALIFPPEGALASVILGALGVTAATVVFSVVYICVIELYPTPMRNMAFSISSVGSKLAAMVAPFVVNIRPKCIASTIFAAAAFTAVLFCLMMPESKGKNLKDTVDDDE